jgi:5-methylcytosine-specific restriction endonuclease McrA
MTYKRNYDDPVYKRARSNVLKRDSYKCQMPSCTKTKRLQVHHVEPWSKASSLRFEEYNLITLCKSCHESIKNKEHLYKPLFMDIIRQNANNS